MYIKVRPAEQGDAAWIRALLERSWGSTEMIVLGRVRHTDALPALVAEIDGMGVGLLTYEVSGDALEVVSLDARERRRGIGTALIDAVRELAEIRRCRRVWLITTNDNLDALRFYQRRGFRLASLHPGAVRAARRLKPSIPEVGEYGIPLRDEIELELVEAKTR
ncbi:MAG: GNAT family N-acetyltransferase [Streptosporangiaceae bacterium]